MRPPHGAFPLQNSAPRMGHVRDRAAFRLKKLSEADHAQPQAEHQKKGESERDSPFSGAGGGARTRTVLPPRDFKSLASASSATPACASCYHRTDPSVKPRSGRDFLLRFFREFDKILRYHTLLFTKYSLKMGLNQRKNTKIKRHIDKENENNTLEN